MSPEDPKPSLDHVSGSDSPSVAADSPSVAATRERGTLAAVVGERTVPLTAFEKLTGHPPGLAVLFLTEMWERFSFYGMRGLLKGYMMYYLFVELRQKLYVEEGTTAGALVQLHGNPSAVLGWHTLEKALLWYDPSLDLQGRASLVYGLYNGLVYLTPVFGGLLADRFFGQRRIVVVGALLMALGHFVMAAENMFFPALILLIIGNGAFKPNISTQVGNLYPPGDKRSDRAYSIFYVGINLGSFICNFICGTLAAVYGWHWGFGAAGVGMLLGLIIYTAGQRYLAPDQRMRAAAVKGPTEPYRSSAHPTPPVEKKPVLSRVEIVAIVSLVVLCALNVPFWAVYEQQGNTMQTWADQQTIWPKLGSFQIPSSWFQSFNPLMIMLFTPLINMFWEWQQRRGKEPSTVSKMAIGSFILGGSFIVMVMGARVLGDGKGSVFWPFLATAILTIGELYLSPIGLSLVVKASPKRMVSLMMGIWFVSSFLGGLLSGVIGVYYTRMTHERFFWMLTVIGILTGVAMWALNKPLRKALGREV